MNTATKEYYLEARKIGVAYIVGENAKNCLLLARKAAVAEKEIGLEVTWEYDEFFSLGDQGDFISDAEYLAGIESGRFDSLCARVDGYNGEILSSLGGIIIDYRQPDWRAYKRSFELELLSEAYDNLLSGN